MIRRTFLSAVFASVAAAFGMKAQASRDAKPRCQEVELLFAEKWERSPWMALPNRVGVWWYRKDEKDFALLVNVFKKDGKLYCRYYNRQEFQYVEKLVSMGGEWRYYSDR